MLAEGIGQWATLTHAVLGLTQDVSDGDVPGRFRTDVECLEDRDAGADERAKGVRHPGQRHLVKELTEYRGLQHPPVPDTPAVHCGDPFLHSDDGPDHHGDDEQHPCARHDVRDLDQDLSGHRQRAAQALEEPLEHWDDEDDHGREDEQHH